MFDSDEVGKQNIVDDYDKSRTEFWKMEFQYVHLHRKGSETTAFHINRYNIPTPFVIHFKVYKVTPDIVTLRSAFIRLY
jgi:hypothetical protein